MNKDIIGYIQNGFYWFSNVKSIFYVFRNGFYIFRFFKGKKNKRNIKIKNPKSNFIFGKKGRHIIKNDFKIIKKAFIVFKERYY